MQFGYDTAHLISAFRKCGKGDNLVYFKLIQETNYEVLKDVYSQSV